VSNELTNPQYREFLNPNVKNFIEINYHSLGEPTLIKILQIADSMEVPPKAVMKAWLLSQCDMEAATPNDLPMPDIFYQQILNQHKIQ
jgi:hypothetical protein